MMVAVDDATRDDACGFGLFVSPVVGFSNGCAGHTCRKCHGEDGNA